jgi:hypothetical protein
MFSGEIHIGERVTKGYLYWVDFDNSKGKSIQCEQVKVIHNRDQFVTWYLSEQPVVLKSILKRYCKHQLKRLEKTELENTAKCAVTYCSDLNKLNGIGSVLSWVKNNQERLNKILPQGHPWAEIIATVILYANSYDSHLEWEKAYKTSLKIQPNNNL